MKKNSLIVITLIAFVTLFLACEKRGFGGTEEISGTVSIKDSLSNNNLPLESAVIYIGFGYIPNASQYSFKTTSDKLGKFIFSDLNKKGDYTLYTEYIRTTGGIKITYDDTRTVNAGDKDLQIALIPNANLNSITGRVMIKDTLTNALKDLSGADVFFGYKIIPTSTNYTYKTVSDINGQFESQKIDLSDASNYTIYVRKNITIGGKSLFFRKTMSYAQFTSGLNTVEVIPNDSVGYLSFKILDVNTTPQPNVNFCIYATRLFFQNAHQCQGSIYSTTTNSAGFSYVSGLLNGNKYYVKGYSFSGVDTLWVKDSITVPNNLYPSFNFTMH